MSGIAHNDRVLVLGPTGSGKSELVNHLFGSIRCQRLLLDSKDEWSVRGVAPTTDVEAIDWRAPLIHYRTGPGAGDGEIDDLFRACFRRRHLVVAAHELEDLCDYRPNKTPPYVRAYLSKGRAHGLGLIGAAQRPVELPKRARTEAQHVFVMLPRPDDTDVIAQTIGVDHGELRELLDETHAAEGDHSALWWDKSEGREYAIVKPLPARLRKRSIVKRTSVA